MNDSFKMYGSLESEIQNKYFVVAMSFNNQPRWHRLQITNRVARAPFYNHVQKFLENA